MAMMATVLLPMQMTMMLPNGPARFAEAGCKEDTLVPDADFGDKDLKN